jgi:hypothetical protein
MHVQEAINSAVAGGYHGNVSDGVRVEEAFLDTAFWQAMGQTLGWKETCDISTAPHRLECEEWLSYWHGYINYLVAGKDPASFFANLPSTRLDKLKV